MTDNLAEQLAKLSDQAAPGAWAGLGGALTTIKAGGRWTMMSDEDEAFVLTLVNAYRAGALVPAADTDDVKAEVRLAIKDRDDG